MFVVFSKLKHWFKISATFILTKNILASQVCLGTSLSHAPTREMVKGRVERRWWQKWRREYGRRLKITKFDQVFGYFWFLVFKTQL